MKGSHFLSVIILFTNCTAKKADISKIEFDADTCFGTCPIFSMSILNNGTAYYDAREFNERQGQFEAVVKKTQLDSLLTLIATADFFGLKDKYSTPITDQSTYTLTVTLKDGTKKTVEDYGQSGPKKLDKVYDLIFSLRKTQNWK